VPELLQLILVPVVVVRGVLDVVHYNCNQPLVSWRECLEPPLLLLRGTNKLAIRKEKKRKRYAFRRYSEEKPM